MNVTYSEKFKARMVSKMLGPSGKGAGELAKEVGVCQPTLSRWLRDSIAGNMVKIKSSNKPVAKPTPTKKSPMDKARLVLEAEGLSTDALGAFLRQHGLHEADLTNWRQTLVGAFDSRPGQREKQQEQKRVRALEQELRKKDKALAETAALLVLKKKLQAVWGDEDDDTHETPGDKF